MIRGSDSIRVETRSSAFDGTPLHSWRCTCGRKGAWLERRDDAQRNGELHLAIEHAPPKFERGTEVKDLSSAECDPPVKVRSATPAQLRNAKARRDRLRSQGLCINAAAHGPATHGCLCESCRITHRATPHRRRAS